jgi:hypothetical protein
VAVCSEQTGTVPGNCCCDRCNSEILRCHECCGCIPSRLCATLSHYDGTSNGALMTPDETGDYGTVTVSGSGVTGCGQEALTISVALEVDEYGQCIGWHIEIPELYVDEYVGPDDYGFVCEDPVFTYDVATEDCTGTLTIQRDEQATLEYVDLYDGCKDHFCSQCRCICEEICFQNVTYSWNGSNGWTSAENETITLSRGETGNCVFTVVGYDPVEVAETYQCGTALSVVIDEYTGAAIICKSCQCENPCPDICVGTGNILVGCGALSEYPVFYLVGQSPRSPLFRNSGEVCCDFPNFLSHDPGTCIWVNTEDLGECEWTFHPEDGPKVQLVKGEFTYVWTSASFDELCTSVFTYDASQSNPDPDCDFYTELCVTPNNGCCDGGDFRDEPLPEVLHVEGAHCCGLDPEDPDPQPIPFEFDITWDPTDRRWKGETEICSGFLRLELYCDCGTSEGCGGGGDPCYFTEVELECFGQAAVDGGGGVVTCACDPFELIVNAGALFTNCCAAEVLIDLDMVIFE